MRAHEHVGAGLIATVPLLAMPALASTTSMPPNAATVPATAPSIDPWSVTSASNQTARSPSSSASALQPLGLQAHQRDAGALGGEPAGGLGADPAGGAGDQHDLVLESLPHGRHRTRLVPVRTGNVTPCHSALAAARRGGGARRAAGEAPERAGLVLAEPVRPALGLHKQPAHLLALVRGQRAPPGLQPEEDDRRAATQLGPGDLLGLGERTASERGHLRQGTDQHSARMFGLRS